MKFGKRFLTFSLAMILVCMCSTTAFAATDLDSNNTIIVGENDEETNIMPLANEFNIGLHVGTTSKSPTRNDFTVTSVFRNARISVSVNVKGPCIMTFELFDSNGKELGTDFITFTEATSITFNASRGIKLPAGKYYYRYSFNKSGLDYNMFVNAII